MTYQEDRALLKSELLQYLNLFVDAIEDTGKERDTARDGEFKAIIQTLDELSFDKFERGSFGLSFTLYRPVFIKNSEIHLATARDCQPIPVKVVQITDSSSSRNAHSFKIQTVEAVKKYARDQVAKYLNTIPTTRTEPANPTGQATPEARDTASTPQTPAGATGNPTPEANQRPQGKNK